MKRLFSIGAIGLALALLLSVGAISQTAPQLGTTKILDGSVASTGANCTASVASGCAARVGVDKTLAINPEGRRTTYRATVAGVVPAASATDVAYIIGSATKTVRITRVRLSGSAGTAVSVPILLIKRSTANSGGTCTAATSVPLDSANAAATAVASTCSANPTLGTIVGNVSAQSVFFSLSSAVGTTGGDFEFGQHGGQPLVLRGVAQTLGINFSTISVSSGVVNVTIEWTEE